MKTNGATWKAYIESWPDGQWYDDCDETINGKELDDQEIPDDAVVEFTCGVVYATRNDFEGSSLTRHFSKWLKAQTNEFVMCQIPKDRAQELAVYLKSIGGKIAKESA